MLRLLLKLKLPPPLPPPLPKPPPPLPPPLPKPLKLQTLKRLTLLKLTHSLLTQMPYPT
jgi:hypothetical protein